MAQVTLPSGITLEYEQHGTGEPLLLVMGLAGQLIDWQPTFIDRLVEAGYQVTTFDNRDSGLSTKTDWTPPRRRRIILAGLLRRPVKGVEYTLDDMADDTAGLIDALGHESMHVAGMSMGGMIGQALAIRHPSKVRSLCSIMSNTGDRKNGNPHWKLPFLTGLPRKKPDRQAFIDDGVKLWRHVSGDHFDEEWVRDHIDASMDRCWTPDGVMRQAAAIAGSADRTPDLQRLGLPTVVIHGMQDMLVVPSGGTATAAAVPGARLLMFPDMGHSIPEPRHDEIVAAIAANTRRAGVATSA